jgi:prophage tail gpP-like protein
VATDQITLTVDGQVYAGWIDVRIDRSLDRFAHSFDLTYVDRWADEVQPWPIRVESAAQIKYGNHILITGQVDVSTMRVSARDWSLRAGGRSKTGVLADCSAIHQSGSWKNKRAIEIARDLVAPYGLTVAISIPDTEVLRRFTIEEGETVQAALDRLAKNRGYLCHTLADGNLGWMRLDTFVGVVGEAPIGEAITREVNEDFQERYSDYYLRAQSFAEAADGDTITVKKKYDGTTDAGVTAHRPLVVVADSAATYAQLKQRADWERNVRAGRSLRYRATFPGILDERGFPWSPGDHHKVRDTALGVDETLLVVSTQISVNDSELATDVEFARPESFSLLEFPPSILNQVTKKGRPKVKKTRIRDLQR